MRLFRSKKTFWERHRFKLLLSSVVVLGALAWSVMERVEQLELSRLSKSQPSDESPKVMATDPVVAPGLVTDRPVVKTDLDVPPPPAPTVLAPQEISSDVPSQVHDALERWSRAWAGQDVSTYLSMYGRQFVPPEGKTRAQWESERRQRILGKKKIQHSVHQLVVSVDGQKATTKFEQIYVADRIQLNQVKVISWQQDEGKWRIVSEGVAP